MKCNKCNIEKPDTDFQTYFHSTQNVYRTRKQCTVCFNEGKKLLRIKNKSKMCIVCEQVKLLVDFYNYKSLVPNDKRRKICRICTATIERERKGNRREAKGEVVPEKPNTYNSEEQKNLSFELMQALGFTFQPDTGIWTKEGFRNEDGTFYRIEEKKRIEREKRLEEVKEMSIWEKIRYLREEGFSIIKISEFTGINYTAVHKFLQYGKEIKFR